MTIRTELGDFQKVEPGSKEHEQLLSVGYGGMTREMAEAIISERKKNPAAWPYAEYQKALAFLAALEAGAPKPTSPHVGTLGRKIEDLG